MELPSHEFLPLVLLLSTTEQSLITSSSTTLQILTNIDEVPTHLFLRIFILLDLIFFPSFRRNSHRNILYFSKEVNKK